MSITLGRKAKIALLLLILLAAGAYTAYRSMFGSTNAVTIRLSPGGSYQVEHVVRGHTNADVLEAMEHDPEALLERLRRASEEAIQSGDLSISDARRLMQHLEGSLGQTTYLAG